MPSDIFIGNSMQQKCIGQWIARWNAGLAVSRLALMAIIKEFDQVHL